MADPCCGFMSLKSATIKIAIANTIFWALVLMISIMFLVFSAASSKPVDDRTEDRFAEKQIEKNETSCSRAKDCPPGNYCQNKICKDKIKNPEIDENYSKEEKPRGNLVGLIFGVIMIIAALIGIVFGIILVFVAYYEKPCILLIWIIVTIFLNLFMIILSFFIHIIVFLLASQWIIFEIYFILVVLMFYFEIRKSQIGPKKGEGAVDRQPSSKSGKSTLSVMANKRKSSAKSGKV